MRWVRRRLRDRRTQNPQHSREAGPQPDPAQCQNDVWSGWERRKSWMRRIASRSRGVASRRRLGFAQSEAIPSSLSEAQAVSGNETVAMAGYATHPAHPAIPPAPHIVLGRRWVRLRFRFGGVIRVLRMSKSQKSVQHPHLRIFPFQLPNPQLLPFTAIQSR